MTRLFTVTALALVSALVLAACGSSSKSSTTSTSAASTAKTPAATAALVTTKKGPLGTFLVDSNGRTLYLWEADKSTKSACNGSCAVAWPPLKATGTTKAAGGVKMSLLGTTKRADGSTEVTYAGHPLYYFAGDSSPGQTTGEGNEGFGAYWWVVTPSGKAIVHGS
jgi:predicted lipoprotein with Yx(FWY)xxD motif